MVEATEEMEATVTATADTEVAAMVTEGLATAAMDLTKAITREDTDQDVVKATVKDATTAGRIGLVTGGNGHTLEIRTAIPMENLFSEERIAFGCSSLERTH